MGRLLLLMTTTTYRASAFLEAASRLNVPVVVGTDERQVLEAANPGGNLTLDFLDPEKAIRRIVEFDRQYRIRAVVAADDDGVILAAMASQTLGLSRNSVEAAGTARNKGRMREVLAEAGLPSPSFHRFMLEEDPEVAARRVAYPCVLKPLFLAGSRGVIRADSPAQFVAAFHRIAAILRRPEVAAHGGALARQILVEGYIPGDEVALEGLLVNGRFKVLALFDKPDPLHGPFFEETIYLTPSRLPATTQERVTACVAQAVEAIGLRDGPVHAELRLNGQGEWIIEIAPRSIGGLCSRTLRFGEGVSLEEVILRHAMGLEVESFDREKRAAGVMMVPIPRAGILREIQGKEEAEAVPGVEEIRLTIPVGQELIPLPEGKRYLGFIFARGGTPEAVESALREAHRLLTFSIAPPGRTWTDGSGLAEVELPTSSTRGTGERHGVRVQGT
ncbi:MAG TPA: ATP-grasp domain-containing protein [Candidatus Methylomirabilis sp.]|nr:ATP-grasp domain-containing protein [Candidatus Methylomirabilis sp.]